MKFASLALIGLALAVLGFSAPEARAAGEDPYLATWSFVWQGALDKYTGKLEIKSKTGDATYAAELTVINSAGRIMMQSAVATVNGSSVRIECSNPRDLAGAPMPSYNPDRFYVVRKGNQMDGYSLDSAGARGSKILFTRL